ncbi:DUF6770 family protein [Lewinella sp. IMCC34183]|uniref:DUF6770 family protein n=1 Tax=Lewinella sp. IMCC34183 TaxID=2248762 RepID=UPI000E26FD5A|nr:DUF6770 family protein [Lewinella sp. IMCC34183]
MSHSIFSLARLLPALLLFTTASLDAQKATFSGIESTYFNKSGVLRSDGAISGYYIVNYHKSEEGDGNYAIQLLDQDLNKVGEKRFDKDPDVRIGAVAYNGELLGVEMVNHEAGRKWVELYDGKGEYVHRRTMKYSPLDAPEVAAGTALFEIQQLVAVPGGFMHFNFSTDSKAATGRSYYRVTFIPNSPEEKGWSTRSSSKTKDYEGAVYLTSDDELVVFGVFKRKSLLSQKFTMEIRAFNIQTGRVAFKYSPDQKADQTRFIKGRIIGDDIVVVGSGVGKSNKVFTDNPETIDVLKFSRAGKLLEKRNLSLQDDLANFLEVKNNGKVKGLGNLMLQDIGVNENQEIVIAGEFFRTFNADVKVEEGMLIQLTPGLEVSDVVIIDKGKTGSLGWSLLSGGIALAKSSTLGIFAKLEGKFDFAYLDDGRELITTAFFSGRSEVRETKRMSLYVNTLLDGELVQEKVEFAAGTDRVTVLPAKEGYIAVIEYDGDTRSLDVHMERLSL